MQLNYDNTILEKDVEIENLKLKVVKLQTEVKYLQNSSSYSPIFTRYEEDIKELNTQIIDQQNYINKLHQQLLDVNEGIIDRSAQKIVNKLRNDLNKLLKEMMYYKNKEREYELNENRVNDLLLKLKAVTKENKKMKEEVKQTNIDILSSDRNNENIDILTNENNQLKMNNKNMKKEIKDLKEYIVKLERERYKSKFMKLMYEKKNPINVETDWKDKYENVTLHRLLDRLKSVIIDVLYIIYYIIIRMYQVL